MKPCTHACVGMLIWKNKKLLLIERNQIPYGYAASAGHVEGRESFEQAAKRELKEEIGLDTVQIKLIGEKRKENPCRYPNGTWHNWKIYAVEVGGDLSLSSEEVRQARFFDENELKNLAQRTQKYLMGEITEDDWQKNPGLEPVWYEHMTELKIIE